MSYEPHERRSVGLSRLIADRSISTKLWIGFGVLLALGALNLAVHHWGARERARAFSELQRAVERQMQLTEVLNLLADQKKFVDVLTGVVGVQQTAAPGEAEQAEFAASVDAIVARMHAVAEGAEPESAADLAGIREKTEALAASWKRFYGLQGRDVTEAIAELYTRAEPLAEELLSEALPAQLERERQHFMQVEAEFVRTDRLFQRVAWGSFLISALLGGLLAVFISRDVLRSIAALKSGAERVGAGVLAHRVPVRNRDELGDVAEAFNQMAERLHQRTEELAARREEIEQQRDELHVTLVHLRETQAQLIQQEKLASLGALTAGIAHEIKNPLNFVNNFAQLSTELAEELAGEVEASRGKAVDEVAEELTAIAADLKLNVAKIEEHGKRADAIVRSMLEHSRGTTGERRCVEVNALVEEYVNLSFHGMRAQRADFTCTLERDYDVDAGSIEVVPQEIGRVLINLLNNAFYAVHERSRRMAKFFAPTVRVSTRRAKGGAEIRVWDNGGGIPEEIRERIFEPFFTTKPTGEGTGLGLSLSYDIVTQVHGGKLMVDVEEGESTRFTIFLPSSPRPLRLSDEHQVRKAT